MGSVFSSPVSWIQTSSQSQVEGTFSLGVDMGSDSIPPKLSDEIINRGLVCAHMHFMARTQKFWTFMSLMGECWQQKHTQHAPSMKTERDYLCG